MLAEGTFFKFKMLRCVAPLTFVLVCTLLPIDACMGGSSSQPAQNRQGGFQDRQVRWSFISYDSGPELLSRLIILLHIVL